MIDLTLVMRPLLLMLAVTTTPASAASGIEQEAGDFIMEQVHQLEDILVLPHGAGRREAFGSWLDGAFDVDRLSRQALGPVRNAATSEQLAAYDAAFSDYIVVTYSDRLDLLAGFEFNVARTRPLSDTDVVVRTDVTNPEDERYVVDFRIRQVDESRFEVMDIAIEGLSMLKTQRDEFGAAIQREGLDGLIEALRTRADSSGAQ